MTFARLVLIQVTKKKKKIVTKLISLLRKIKSSVLLPQHRVPHLQIRSFPSPNRQRLLEAQFHYWVPKHITVLPG